jgi:hypothetical protein
MRSVTAFAALALLLFVPSFSGCAGVSTYFAIDAQVALRDEIGRVTTASPDAIKPLPVGPNVESLFPVIQYQHSAFV